MSLPISTPPNALAHATGYTDTNGMAKTGIVMGVFGLALSWLMMILLAKMNFFGTPAPKAAEAAPAAPVAAEKVVATPALETKAEAAAPAALDSAVAIPADSAAKVVVADSAAAPAAAPATAK
jgi:sodium-dependent dicarboxylate transporter 2/3/5